MSSDIRNIASFEPRGVDFPQEILSGEKKSAILGYLRSFEPVYRTAGHVFDPVKQAYTNVDLVACTDGRWGWCSNDEYLFEKYNLALDREFVAMF